MACGLTLSTEVIGFVPIFFRCCQNPMLSHGVFFAAVLYHNNASVAPPLYQYIFVRAFLYQKASSGDQCPREFFRFFVVFSFITDVPIIFLDSSIMLNCFSLAAL